MGAGPVIGGTPSHLSAGEATVRRAGTAWPAAALFAGLALMVMAWTAATPLGQAADEPAHYIKALAAGRGDLHGGETDLANVHALANAVKRHRATDDREAQVRALRFISEASGSFVLPRALVPEIGCFNSLFRRADTSLPARCVTFVWGQPRETGSFATYVAAYPPFVYVPAGLAMRAAGDDDAPGAYRLGRGTFGLIALALVGLALLALWDAQAGALSLVGAMVATTPMSLWSFSVLNTSGLEIAAATCWTAGLLRLLRAAPPPRWVWAATAAGGVVLATARPSGPLFVVAIPVGIAVVFGLTRLLTLARRESTAALAAALAVAVALLAALFWQRYMPDYSLGVDTLLDSVSPALEGLPRAFREAVGRFAGDLFIPVPLAIAWGLILAALVIAAGVVARPLRLRLALLALGTLAFIAVYATAYLTSGFDEFYGRYALPGLVVLPLCAGAVLAEHSAEVTAVLRRWLVGAIAFGTGTIHLLAWWLESRRIAVGTDGPLLFPSDAGWSPPGSWWLWIAAMLAGTALVTVPWLGRGPTPSAPLAQLPRAPRR